MFFRLFTETVLSAEAPPQPLLAVQRRPECLALSSAAALLRYAATRRCTILNRALCGVVKSTDGFLRNDLANPKGVSLRLVRSAKFVRQCERIEAQICVISKKSIPQRRQIKIFLKLTASDICPIQNLNAVSECLVSKVGALVMNCWNILNTHYCSLGWGLILKASESLLKYKYIAGPKSE